MKISTLIQVLVAHTYKPNYLGGWNQKDWGLRPAQAKCFQGPISKNNQSQMDWRYGSRNRVPALQAQSPEFKSQSHQ
jgi:hypothetical protein